MKSKKKFGPIKTQKDIDRLGKKLGYEKPKTAKAGHFNEYLKNPIIGRK